MGVVAKVRTRASRTNIEDTLLVVDDMTRDTSNERLLLRVTVVKIPADNPTLSTINSISLEDSN